MVCLPPIMHTRHANDRPSGNTITSMDNDPVEIRIRRHNASAVVDRHGGVSYNSAGEPDRAGACGSNRRTGRNGYVDSPVSGPSPDRGEGPHDLASGRHAEPNAVERERSGDKCDHNQRSYHQYPTPPPPRSTYRIGSAAPRYPMVSMRELTDA